MGRERDYWRRTSGESNLVRQTLQKTPSTLLNGSRQTVIECSERSRPLAKPRDGTLSYSNLLILFVYDVTSKASNPSRVKHCAKLSKMTALQLRTHSTSNRFKLSALRIHYTFDGQGPLLGASPLHKSVTERTH